MVARLTTIPLSHYCEKARWALDRQRVPYVEHGHLPLFAWGPALWAGGKRTVPVLVDDDGRAHASSSEIVAYADARRGDRPALLPAAQDAEVRAWVARFDKDLGPAARRIAYAAVLPDKALALALVGDGAPAWEVALARPAFPLIARLLKRGLKIDDAGVARSRAKLAAVFAAVEQLLGEGRRYLVGDALTAADLTFAALAAPLLLPPEYPTRWPSLDALPQPFRDELRGYQERPAGAFGLRLYRDDRRA